MGFIYLFTYCASTVELEAAGRGGGGGDEWPWEFTLWSLHLKDPACVAGAQTQVLIPWPAEQEDSLDDHERFNFPKDGFLPCSLHCSAAETKVEAIFSRPAATGRSQKTKITCKKIGRRRRWASVSRVNYNHTRKITETNRVSTWKCTTQA